MEPLVFEPLLKRIRWGGRLLGEVLDKPIGAESDYAESWEIADQPNDQTVVATGKFAGQTLHEVLQAVPEQLLGRQTHLTQFPLLIKFLDANDWLSLQVHPDDSQALAYAENGRGKTEAWIILHAEPDSQICAGLKPGTDRSEFEAALSEGRVEQTLNMIPARAGDCVFVPARTVHALGPGILLAEIQQQSNITFRLHDWGRMGADGQPRELHIEQSLQCIDFEAGPVAPVSAVELSDGTHHFEELVRCDYFVIRRHQAIDEFSLALNDRFRILMVMEGRAVIRTSGGQVTLGKGRTTLIPAAAGTVHILPEGNTTLLEVLHP
ncbi:MAG: class I mannose-6-phosphate isomerase [Planctomycetaceae bacterium]|nr:class I mannose-6-phosphate isomerase [Planctomycetaceae bacterium]